MSPEVSSSLDISFDIMMQNQRHIRKPTLPDILVEWTKVPPVIAFLQVISNRHNHLIRLFSNIIGVSVSEPHTSESNWHILSGVRYAEYL